MNHTIGLSVQIHICPQLCVVFSWIIDKRLWHHKHLDDFFSYEWIWIIKFHLYALLWVVTYCKDVDLGGRSALCIINLKVWFNPISPLDSPQWDEVEIYEIKVITRDIGNDMSTAISNLELHFLFMDVNVCSS